MRYWPQVLLIGLVLGAGAVYAQQKGKKGKGAAAPNAAAKANAANAADARNVATGKAQEPRDPELAKYGIYEQSAPRPAATAAITTELPLVLQPGEHVAFIGNTLFE